MVFMLLFNFLEPACTIIAQTIPIFRVLISRVKRATQRSKTSGVQMHPPTSHVELVATKSGSLNRDVVWDGTSSKRGSEGDGFRDSKV
jgi:hypothetical protein